MLRKPLSKEEIDRITLRIRTPLIEREEPAESDDPEITLLHARIDELERRLSEATPVNLLRRMRYLQNKVNEVLNERRKNAFPSY